MLKRTLATLMLALLVPWAAALAESVPLYRVIVDPHNPTSSIERKTLADAFLKKTTRWSDGETILPVDLEADAATRRAFSEDVLKRSVPAVRSYWQQLIFSGRDVPPAELESDADVVKYVLQHRGAIGYVSGSAEVGAAKVLNVR